MENPIIELRNLVEQASQKSVATKLGFSQQYLCDVLRGRKEPGAKILDALGLERVITYRRKR